MKRFLITAAAGILGCIVAVQGHAQTQNFPPLDGKGKCFQARPSELAITTGSEACHSSAYYQRIAQFLGNLNFSEISLGEVAGYMGYDVSYTGRDLETMIPIATLGTPLPKLTEAQKFWYDRQNEQDANLRVLVSRFFAPKIVNYSATSGPYVPGWRKLVYLPVRSGSMADTVGKVSGAYILFNYAAQDRLRDPYAASGGDGHAISKNNQVILVPKDLRAQVPGSYRDSAFFAVYSGYIPGDKNNSYRLLNTLDAGFDVPADGGNKAYAIPDACAQCHGHDAEFGQAVEADGRISTNPRGGVFPFVKPNYLDTDQWYDAQRLDYGDLIGTLEPVFDGGTDRTSAQYRKAMDVIFALNSLMEQQAAPAKRTVSGSAPTDGFQRAAVAKWLSLHGPVQDRTKVFSPVERLFNTDSGNTHLIKGDVPLATDQLSQFCFRCHSSIKFNVFVYSYIQKNAATLRGYIPPMPLGRSFRGTEKACFTALLISLGTAGNSAAHKVIQDCDSSFLMKGVSAETDGYCYVLPGDGFADGTKIMQAKCGSTGHAEKIWKFDAVTGRIHSASRPDKCLAVAPIYVDRPARLIKNTPFTGAVKQYDYQPVVLQSCENSLEDLRMTWTVEYLGKMVMIRSKEDRDLCLSGTDEYHIGNPLTDAYAENCRGRQPNGSFFMRTFEPTKGAALAAMQ